MKPVSEMSIGEVAALIAEHLRISGIEVVLTGGSCVSIYSENRYVSYDLDFIDQVGAKRKAIAACLQQIGFKEKNRYFINPETPFFVEFPAGPLAIGDEPVREVAKLEFSSGSLRLLTPTDCVKDRLANFYYWKDRQCLEQAIFVSQSRDIDLDEVARWSQHEGMIEEFERVKPLLTRKY